MIDTRDFLLDELSKNRETYKELLQPIRLNKDELIKTQDVIWYQEIMDSYKDAIVEVLVEDLAPRFPQIYIDDLIGTLEDLDLLGFFEPEN